MTPEHLAAMQSLFQIDELRPIALRAIGPKLPPQNLHFGAAEYPVIADRWEAFSQQALLLNAQRYNIYTCLNPIVADFNADAVTDNDIACRRLLLIDLDRAGSCKDPATDDEIRDAFAVADKIEDWFRSQSDAKPTRVMSGNGIHLYYPLHDLPNDSATRDCCRSLLRELGERFDTETIKVDTSVSNAGRITKVPGTVAYKGTKTAERPFRQASFL